MVNWQIFFIDYLTYLGLPFQVDSDRIYTFDIDNADNNRVYTFNKENSFNGIIGFYPGTEFYYRVLNSSLEKGAFAKAYLTKIDLDTSLNQTLFTPHLYLYVKLVSPAPKSPRKNFSIMVNLYNGSISEPIIDQFIEAKKGPSMKRKLTYKEAFRTALLYMQDKLKEEKSWLEETLAQKDSFFQKLDRANLNTTEERQRILEAESRLNPHFNAQIKLLGLFNIK